MTLILTHLSKFGIIHASDSNLTSGQGPAGKGQKTFPLPNLNAGLTLAGAYSVAGQAMSSWMSSFIQSQHNVTSLAAFADALKTRLESEMLADEKDAGSMVHIAGYAEQGGMWHPEFYFVRNVYRMDSATGEYADIRHQFQVSEDFWSRDCPNASPNAMTAFQSGAYQIYINGFTSGRIGYMILQQRMNVFFREIWNNPQWRFRGPQSLSETALLVKLYMKTIETLFRVSDYSGPPIGGRCQIHKIRQPRHTVTTC